tara:strand:+ start:8607 stop:8924 length:318 start_codon:yes stop_codon:yes gene_type:complete
LEQIAFGELHMTVNEFYNMTPRNFINAQIGLKNLYEQNQQAEWERARWMACVIINPHLKRSIDPKKITKFPWEIAARRKKAKKFDIEKLLKESEYQDKLHNLKMK